MRKDARTVAGAAMLLLIASPALADLPRDAVDAARNIAHRLTAAQFPEEERPYVPLSEARWEGCEPLPVLLNVPEPLTNDIASALNELASASGRSFYIAGTTTRTPTTLWPRDGQRADPGHTDPAIIIAVANHRETDLLERHYRAAAITNPRDGIYVTGAIAIAESVVRRWPPGSEQMRRLLLHELGHLAGLGHAREGTIMNAHVHEGGPDGYTPQDLEGIAAMFNCRNP